jgi:hypothetical protein
MSQVGFLQRTTIWGAVLAAFLGCGFAPAYAAANGGDDPSVAQCDSLTSHPHDPNRYAAGVTDEQLAPGIAIKACEAAVKVSRNEARLWFELGRAYWVAKRYPNGFAAFVEAAKRNYAPAMKYIGDAYLTGHGLPNGEKQDAYTALKWYKKSAAGGFEDADAAVDSTTGYLQSITFNPDAFVGKSYMARIYNNEFDGVDDDKDFLVYISGFIDEFGGDQILFIKPECKPMATALASMNLNVQASLGMFGQLLPQMLNGQVTDQMQQIMAWKVIEDQGARDAVALVNQYGCTGRIAKTVMSNIVHQFGN